MTQIRRTSRRLRSTTAVATVMVATAVLVPSSAQATVTLRSSLNTFGVQDSTPNGAVGGVQSPAEAGSTLSLSIDASDTGSGLASAQASIDGNTASVSLCPASLAGNCPETVVNVPLSIDVGGAGSHELLVSVTDTAGNTATIVDETITVIGPTPPGSNTVTIGIGSEDGSPEGGPPGGGRGGVSGASFSSPSTVCRSPLLAMRLVSRPLRYAKVKKRRIPVLRARRDYTYRGRLTCVHGGRRVSAPTGTVVHVFYKIGRRPARRSDRGTMTVHSGKLRAILGYSYTSTRTIIFRYSQAGGGVEVGIRIEIARRHTDNQPPTGRGGAR